MNNLLRFPEMGRPFRFLGALTLFLFWWYGNGNAAGPSFNCRTALQVDEIAICSNKNLADLDRRMDKRFRQVRDSVNHDLAIALARNALVDRHACGSRVACIQDVLLKELEALGDLQFSVPRHGEQKIVNPRTPKPSNQPGIAEVPGADPTCATEEKKCHDSVCALPLSDKTYMENMVNNYERWVKQARGQSRRQLMQERLEDAANRSSLTSQAWGQCHVMCTNLHLRCVMDARNRSTNGLTPQDFMVRAWDELEKIRRGDLVHM
jgi:uncharacterized protein